MQYALDLSLTPIWIKITLGTFGFFALLGPIGFIGFRWKDGLWGAILMSFNLLFATLISMNYFETLGKLISSKLPVGIFYWDSLAFVLILMISFGIFNMITNRLSRVIVSFPKPVEYIAMPLLLLCVWFCLFGSVTYFVVQICATAPEPVAGTVKIEEDGLPFDDKLVRGMAKTASKGSLSALNGPNEFDPNNDFLMRHYKRRCALFDELWKTGNSRFSGKAEFLD